MPTINTAEPHRCFSADEFSQEVKDAADKLFKSRPWATTESGGPRDKAQKWCDRMAEIDRVPEVIVDIGAFNGHGYVTSDGRLLLSYMSITSLFGAWRGYVLKHRIESGELSFEDARADPGCWAWAYSLFFTVRPELFMEAARKGKMPLYVPSDRLQVDVDPNAVADDDEDEDDDEDDFEFERDDQVIDPAGDAQEYQFSPIGQIGDLPPRDVEVTQRPERGNCSGCGQRTRTWVNGQFRCRTCSVPVSR